MKRRAEGLKYVYSPAAPKEKARRSAVKHVLDTYFSGSPEQIVAVLLDVSAAKLTREELDGMIEKAKKEGR